MLHPPRHPRTTTSPTSLRSPNLGRQTPLFNREPNSLSSTFLLIDKDPDDECGEETEDEKEDESVP